VTEQESFGISDPDEVWLLGQWPVYPGSHGLKCRPRYLYHPKQNRDFSLNTNVIDDSPAPSKSRLNFLYGAVREATDATTIAWLTDRLRIAVRCRRRRKSSTRRAVESAYHCPYSAMST